MSSLLGFKCPICSKSVASDEMEIHFIMCLSKPRLSYNGKGYLSCLLPGVEMGWTAGGIAFGEGALLFSFSSTVHVHVRNLLFLRALVIISWVG